MAQQPQVGITAKKNADFSEWYTQVVLKGGLVDYAPVAGFIVLKPGGYAIWESIRDILDQKLKQTGHHNAFLPVLIPEGLLSKESDHFSGFTPEVFWVTQAGNNPLKERLAVRPTSETLAYSIISKWITSYRDLPLKLNFWNSALRAEISQTKPFVRTSEFLWQEGHTVHGSEEEAKKEVMDILDIYRDLMENYLALPAISGYKSEKEKFVGADFTTTLEGLMPDGKALQMGTSHHLGQNFSKPFGIKYLGTDMAEHFAWQASWGVSWRLIGAIVMVHGDDKGLVLPPRVAPIQVVIVPIHRDKDAEMVKSHARQLAAELATAGVRSHCDEREEYTSGWKFNEWELRGVPLRINIGPRDIENGQVELVRRDTKEKFFKPRAGLDDSVKQVLQAIQTDLYLKAKTARDGAIHTISNYDNFKTALPAGGLFRAGWCGDQECEIKIKEQTGADIRVVPFDQDGIPAECIYCGRPSKKLALLGRAY